MYFMSNKHNFVFSLKGKIYIYFINLILYTPQWYVILELMVLPSLGQNNTITVELTDARYRLYFMPSFHSFYPHWSVTNG